MPTAGRPTIAFASHELWPFVQGGGIARSLWAAATLLSEHADVTVVTASDWESAYRELPGDDPRALPGVRVLFAPTPEGVLAPLRSWHHRWSLSLLETLRTAFPDRGPGLLEFNDYWGEGAMTVEARRSGEPFLRETTIAVRTRTTHEIAASLNGGTLGALERTMHGLERCALVGADAIVYPGGDVAGLYERFYGADVLAPRVRLPEVFMPQAPEPADREPPAGDVLRLLYVGRLERRKGVQELIEAMRRLDADDVTLTLVGGDTQSAPDGGSMRAYLQERAAADPRITFRDRVPHGELPAIMRAHHVVISSSRWESWSNVVRESLATNRPVLATPVGAVIDAIVPGRSGWMTEGGSAEQLLEGIERLRGRSAEIAGLIAEGTPRECLDSMIGHDRITAAELDLATATPEPPRGAPIALPIAVLLQWAGDHAAFARAAGALRAAELPLRVVLVSSAGLPAAAHGAALADAVLTEAGDSAGEVLRAALRRVREETVLLLDARDVLDPSFLPRALAALERDAGLAYAGSLSKAYAPPAPLPNAAVHALGEGIRSGPILVRRDDLRFDELAKAPATDLANAVAVALAGRGRWGTVIPEPLVRRARSGRPPEPDEGRPAREVPDEMWRVPSGAQP